MDDALRRAERSQDPIAIIVMSERAGAPTTEHEVWARALDVFLSLPSPEAFSTTLEYVAAVVEAEVGVYPCRCATAPADCPVHGPDLKEQTRGTRFVRWLVGDAEEQGVDAALPRTVARLIRRLATEF